MMTPVKQLPYVRTTDALLTSLLAHAPKPTPEQLSKQPTSRKVNWAAVNHAGGYRSNERWNGQ